MQAKTPTCSLLRCRRLRLQRGRRHEPHVGADAAPHGDYCALCDPTNPACTDPGSSIRFFAAEFTDSIHVQSRHPLCDEAPSSSRTSPRAAVPPRKDRFAVSRPSKHASPTGGSSPPIPAMRGTRPTRHCRPTRRCPTPNCPRTRPCLMPNRCLTRTLAGRRGVTERRDPLPDVGSTPPPDASPPARCRQGRHRHAARCHHHVARRHGSRALGGSDPHPVYGFSSDTSLSNPVTPYTSTPTIAACRRALGARGAPPPGFVRGGGVSHAIRMTRGSPAICVWIEATSGPWTSSALPPSTTMRTERALSAIFCRSASGALRGRR